MHTTTCESRRDCYDRDGECLELDLRVLTRGARIQTIRVARGVWTALSRRDRIKGDSDIKIESFARGFATLVNFTPKLGG